MVRALVGWHQTNVVLPDRAELQVATAQKKKLADPGGGPQDRRARGTGACHFRPPAQMQYRMVRSKVHTGFLRTGSAVRLG